MSDLAELLGQRVAQGEADLQQALRAPLTGGTVRSFLPQTWVVITERETLTVHADLEGRISVRAGDAMVRDGAIAIGYDLLSESLRTGKTPQPNAVRTTFYTKKGEAAFGQLARFFGV